MEKEQKKKVRLNIDCSIEDRKMVRLLAAKEDKSISKYILELVRRDYESESQILGELVPILANRQRE